MSQGQVARAVANLNWVHSTTTKLTENWPDAKATFQAAPTDNHLIWTLGYPACTYGWFKTLVAGGDVGLPETYNTLFGYGSKPNPLASEYPPIAEVRANFEKSYAALLAAAEKMTDAEGLLPCQGEAHGFAADRLQALDRAAWHDGWHSGQLGSLRKTLGQPSVVG